MDIKTWKIKEKFLKNGVPDLLLKAMNNDLGNFANFNQSIGAICEAVNPKHIEALFQVYTTFGIYLAQNKMVSINFKQKEDNPEKPQSYLG